MLHMVVVNQLGLDEELCYRLLRLWVRLISSWVLVMHVFVDEVGV